MGEKFAFTLRHTFTHTYKEHSNSLRIGSLRLFSIVLVINKKQNLHTEVKKKVIKKPLDKKVHFYAY